MKKSSLRTSAFSLGSRFVGRAYSQTFDSIVIAHLLLSSSRLLKGSRLLNGSSEYENISGIRRMVQGLEITSDSFSAPWCRIADL